MSGSGKAPGERDLTVVSIGKTALIPPARLEWRREGVEVAMAVVELTLFGGFEGRLAGGQVVALPGQKDRALLAILALQPGATHTRDKLASLLWSDRGDQQARDSLKHSLTRIRQCLEPAADRRRPPVGQARPSRRGQRRRHVRAAARRGDTGGHGAGVGALSWRSP